MPTSNKVGGRGSKKQEVTVLPIDFDVPDLRALDDRLGLELRNTDSRLRNLINSGRENFTCEREYDVLFIVQHALQDAVQICNLIIGKKVNVLSHPTLTLPKLCVRFESSLFSNIVDHAVVFDAVSGHRVFIVEVKTRWRDETKSPSTKKAKHNANVSSTSSVATNLAPRPSAQNWEHVYDQLSEMHAKGHPNPFGALTCFDETYITCLDTTACKEVLEILSTMGYEDSRLDRIVSNLVQTNATISTPNNTENVDTSSIINTTKPKFYENEDCHVWHSACFVPDNIVAAFVNAIICSLDGFQTCHYAIKSIEVGQNITVGALGMSEKSHFWGTLQTTYQGPKKLKGRIGPLYLVDHLGTGSTSKVYHALRLNGYECVVKMYVMRKDEDKNCILTEEEFMKNAKAAVKREYKAYKEIYGKELEGYVRMMKLNGLHCLILPYFKHVDKSQRSSLLSSTIRERLQLFHIEKRNTFYAFDVSDQLWRHIGWFNGKLYLFDLGDLEEYELVDKNDLIEFHCKRLAARIEE